VGAAREIITTNDTGFGAVDDSILIIDILLNYYKSVSVVIAVLSVKRKSNSKYLE
jgi:hypothetical protein